MSDQMPPSRRRPTSTGAQSVSRSGPRRTGAQRPAPEPSPMVGEAKLICTAGPKAGTEFPLSGDDERVIGRAVDNPLSIPDTSVSRRHCSVRRGEGGWTISDLGSGNGTVINGDRIEAETVLRNGDVITIGDTELSFEDAANATVMRPMPVRRGQAEAAPVRRSIPGRPDVRARLSRPGAPPAADPAKKRRLLLVGGAALVVILGGLVAAVAVKGKAREAEEAELAAKLQRRDAIRALFQDGKNLILEGKWTEAKGKFEEVKAAAPGYPGVDDYLARANIEIPNQDHLTHAEKALGANQLAAASAELGAVSKDTQQFERLRKLNGALERKQEERLREATALLNTTGEKDARRAAFVQAQEITDDLLKFTPDHRDAQIVNENAKKLIAQIDYVAPPPPPEPKRPWVAVRARYSAGDVSGALSLADECAGGFKECRAIAKDIREFATLYKRVEDLDARGLARLLALDKDISDGRGSVMGRTAGTRASGIFYRNASSAKNSGQWGRAIEWAQRCLGADPGNSGCKGIVEEVRGHSKDEYLRCYALKDTNPDEALSCFRGVMQMTQKSDETYEKARNWVEKLGQ